MNTLKMFAGNRFRSMDVISLLVFNPEIFPDFFHTVLPTNGYQNKAARLREGKWI